MSFDEVKGTNVGNSKQVKHIGQSTANKQTTNTPIIKLNGNNTGANAGKGTSVEKTITLKSGRQIVTKDGETTYRAADGTELNRRYFLTSTSVGIQSNIAKQARKDFEAQLASDGWAGKTADTVSALWGSKNRASKVEADLTTYENQLKELAKACKLNNPKVFNDKFKEIYGIKYNADNIEAYIKNPTDENYAKAYGTENDIARRVAVYNKSQQVGGEVVKGTVVAGATVGAAIATGGSSLLATAAVAGGTAFAAREAVELTDLATNDIDGDINKESVTEITKEALVEGGLAAGTCGIVKGGGSAVAVKGGMSLVGAAVVSSCSDSDDLSSTSAEAKAETGITKGYIANYVCNTLNNQADGNKTTDGITYSFWSTADNKDNVTAGIKVGENLQLTFGKDITNKNTVDYINQIKPNLKTDDGYGYSYTVDASDNAQVTFTKDDGGDAVTYTHQVGNDLTLGGVAKSLNDMLNTIGLGAGDGELPLGLNSSKDSYDQSKDGLQLKLLSTNLDDIASGNVNVQLSIGTQQVTGKLSTQGGNIKIGDGAAVSRIEKYKTADGDEVSGLMVNIGDDKFIITTDYGHKVDIITNFDDEDRISTRNYETSSSTFNTSNATDADEYFNDKKGNLTTAEDRAKERYDELFNANKSELEANTSSGASVK